MLCNLSISIPVVSDDDELKLRVRLEALPCGSRGRIKVRPCPVHDALDIYVNSSLTLPCLSFILEVIQVCRFWYPCCYQTPSPACHSRSLHVLYRKDSKQGIPRHKKLCAGLARGLQTLPSPIWREPSQRCPTTHIWKMEA